MVDITQVGPAGILIEEIRNIRSAIGRLEAGNAITSFVIGGTFSVFSEDMEYPPQMTAAIRQLLEQRLSAIESQLAEMGVTGIDSVGPRAAAAAPPPERSAPRRK